jgi:Xaa-Pro aminopeptidase
VLVTAAPAVAGAEKPLDCFETLTLAPIDRRLIARALLDEGEIAWLDAYHAEVRAALTPLVDDATSEWLAAATAPLGNS